MYKCVDIQAATALGANFGVCDYLGILVSRLNARVFIEVKYNCCVNHTRREKNENTAAHAESPFILAFRP
jgi:uridylate kinase